MMRQRATASLMILLCAHSVGALGTGRIRVLILTGRNIHDWCATTPVMRDILERTGRFEVRFNEEVQGCGLQTFAPDHVLLLNYNHGNPPTWWDNRPREALLDFVRNGKGLVSFHASNNGFPGWHDYDRLIGGTWRETAGHSPYHTYTVKIVDHDSLIRRGLPDSFLQTDELCHRLSLQPNIRILAAASDDPANCVKLGKECGTGRDEPLI